MLGVVSSNLITRSIFSHIGDLTAPGTPRVGRACCGFSRVRPSPVPTVDATLERLVNEGRHKRLEPEQIALVMIQRYRQPRAVSDDDRHVISVAANCCVTRVEAVEGQLVEQQSGVPERQMAPDNPVLERGTVIAMIPSGLVRAMQRLMKAPDRSDAPARGRPRRSRKPSPRVK